jgi:N,N'-diacetyllegionaminate synthase
MKKVLIIAEAGVNHNGDINLAKKLIDAAAEAGVDYVKFQTFKTEKLVSLLAKKAKYQSENFNDGNDSQFQMLKKLELNENDHLQLIEHCKLRNIQFLSTGFDEESVDDLEKLGINIFKIPSGEITNKPYLEHIASKGKPIILSTGMANLEEIQNAIEVFMQKGVKKENITVLHCNTEYPTPMQDVNLRAMLHIQEQIGVEIGYSDHTLGIEVPIAAVALGAKVIEKHFTLDRNMPGPDHAASLEPYELKAMVKAIRNVELALSGDGIKKPSSSEINNLSIVRKSIHVNKPLSKGHTITKKDLIMLRPGNGISPLNYDAIIGKKLNVDLAAFEMLNENHFS